MTALTNQNSIREEIKKSETACYNSVRYLLSFSLLAKKV